MESKLRKYADAVICIAGAIAFLYLFFKFAPAVLMPFLLGWLTSLLLSAPAKKISSHSKMPLKISSGITVILFFLCSGLILGWVINRLALEVENIAERMYSDPEALARAIDSARQKLHIAQSNHPFLERLGKIEGMEKIARGIENSIQNGASGIVSALTSKLPNIAAGAVAGMPEVLLFFISYLLSTFYFCVDREKVSAFFEKILPEALKKRLPALKKRAGNLFSKYLKAYLLIMLITFGEVFLGLTVLRINYAFLLALIISAIDVLPVLGAGTVLIPWSVYCFIVSDTRTGVGLLILFAVVTVVRQIAEPRIVGKSIGLHPLAVLFSVWAGIKLLGFGGLFVGPVAALAVKGLWKDE